MAELAMLLFILEAYLLHLHYCYVSCLSCHFISSTSCEQVL